MGASTGRMIFYPARGAGRGAPYERGTLVRLQTTIHMNEFIKRR